MAGFRKSLIYTYTGKYLVVVIQFVGTMILARLLTPEDIGIYTVAGVFVGLGHLLREFGVASYIIQEKELTPDRIRAAFTLNFAFGWGIAVLLYFASLKIGAFYDSDSVSQVVKLLCINFLLVPVGAISYSLIRREMQFRNLMSIQVIRALVASSVAVFAAYSGQAYLSLVWSAIAGTGTVIVLTFLLRPGAMIYGFGIKEIPHVFAYCKYAGSGSLVMYVGSTAPEWILGKMQGMSAVGIFSKAAGLQNMFRQAFLDGLSSVTLPHFSRQHRESAVDIAQYLKLLDHVTAIAWPFFVVLLVLAEPVVYVLFGSQWSDSVPVLQVLCIGALANYGAIFVDQLLTVTGRIKVLFRIIIVTQAVAIFAIVIAAPYGLVWVGVAIVCVNFIRYTVDILVCCQVFSLPVRSIYGIYARNASLTLSCGAAAYAGLTLLGATGLYSPIVLALLMILVACVWLVGIFVFQISLRHDFINTIKLVLRQLGKPKEGKAVNDEN